MTGTVHCSCRTRFSLKTKHLFENGWPEPVGGFSPLGRNDPSGAGLEWRTRPTFSRYG